MDLIDMDKKIAEIRWGMFENKITQRELAKKAGIHHTFLSTILKRKRTTSIATINKIINAFNELKED